MEGEEVNRSWQVAAAAGPGSAPEGQQAASNVQQEVVGFIWRDDICAGEVLLRVKEGEVVETFVGHARCMLPAARWFLAFCLLPAASWSRIKWTQ